MKRAARSQRTNKPNVIILNETAANSNLTGSGVSATTTAVNTTSVTLSGFTPIDPISDVNVLGQPNKMDHYVMQTVKLEPNAVGKHAETEETIDFVLTASDNDHQPTLSGEITEELHLDNGDGDDDEDSENSSERPQEIIEHVCGKCFRTFRRLKGLKKHLDYCRFDSAYRQRKAEMLNNLKKIEKDAVMMENKDVCFCCGESYDTYHLGHINCPDCPKSFKTQMSYERHIFINHSENDDYPCSICNAKLRSENLLHMHEEQHRTRGKPFACKVCGKEFTRSYHLQRHNKYSSCTAAETTTVVCKVCQKSFFRLDNLRAHLKQHLGTQVAKKREYMCPICMNCFYSLSTLNIHTRTHTGERPYDCDLCVKKFPSLVALKKHRRYHTGEKPYTCTVCQQSFAVKEVLNRHMKRHTGERPYECSECGKSFIQGVQLRNHIKTHIRPYECDECTEKFKTERQLERHQKQHRPQAQRRGRAKSQYKCEKCRRTFKTEQLFEQHMADGIHISPAQKRKLKNRTDCEKCQKNFESVQSLKFHILKEHTDVDENPVNVANNNKEQEVTQENSQINIEIETEPTQQKPSRKTRSRVKEQTQSPPKRIKLEKATEAAKVEEERRHQETKVLQEFIIENSNNASASVSVRDSDEVASNVSYVECASTNTMWRNTTTIGDDNNVTDELSPRKPPLVESLVVAAVDNEDSGETNIESNELLLDAEALSSDDLKLKYNVRKLLDVMVDKPTLEKLGWPEKSEEEVLCKVIENCDHDLSKDAYNYSEWDYGTRMREYTKLLFTVVLRNNSIKELLNNYQVDEVIDFVLGNYEEDDDDNQQQQREEEQYSEKDKKATDERTTSKFKIKNEGE